MTVKELIEKLQSIPESMKNCEVEMYQTDDPFADTISIDKLRVYVSTTQYSGKEMLIEEAEKVNGYKYVVLM